MFTSTIEARIPQAQEVTVTEDTLQVELSDGRTISVPLASYPRLVQASQEERNRWERIGEVRESGGPTWTKTSASRG